MNCVKLLEILGSRCRDCENYYLLWYGAFNFTDLLRGIYCPHLQDGDEITANKQCAAGKHICRGFLKRFNKLCHNPCVECHNISLCFGISRIDPSETPTQSFRERRWNDCALYFERETNKNLWQLLSVIFRSLYFIEPHLALNIYYFRKLIRYPSCTTLVLPPLVTNCFPDLLHSHSCSRFSRVAAPAVAVSSGRIAPCFQSVPTTSVLDFFEIVSGYLF